MTEAMQQFLDAEKEFEQRRKHWNALPTPEARHAVPEAEKPNNRLVMDAARAFARDASGRHKIEEIAKVYLILDGDNWRVDSTSGDGYPLDGYDNGPLNEACEGAEEDGHSDEECEALKHAAQWVSLPDLIDLKDMIDSFFREA